MRRRRYHSLIGMDAEEQASRPLLVRTALVVAAALLLVYGVWKLPSLFSSSTVLRVGTTLSVRGDGVSVRIGTSQSQQAENGQKLYPGEQVATSGTSTVALSFFDGTVLRLDHGGSLTIRDVTQGTEESTIAVILSAGTLWVSTPIKGTATGSITREIVLPTSTVTLPAGTEALVGIEGISVFNADGLGLAVAFKGVESPIYVGEGQALRIPSTPTAVEDMYAYRTPLNPADAAAPFVVESRQVASGISSSPLPGTTGQTAAITLDSPPEGVTLRGVNVTVRGTIRTGIERVRVNGYSAEVTGNGYSITLPLQPNTNDLSLTVQALDARGEITDQVVRNLKIEHVELLPPSITSPAPAGQTFTTEKTELLIQGNAPEGAAAIFVNDYKLQFFAPGEPWKYIASIALGNLHAGSNVYTVVAVDANGVQSPAATLTIVVGPDVTVPPTTPSTLPNNAPLKPGTLSVTSPAAGTSYATSTGTLVVEGSTDATTSTMWVNDYQLQLYKAGRTVWNYRAEEGLGTLKKGTNTYVITARDSQNQIIDTLTYTITW